MKRFLSAFLSAASLWLLLVLFLCTGCNRNHSGKARQCNTPEQREALNCDRPLENPLGKHAWACDLPDCNPLPEPCEDGKGKGDPHHHCD